MKDYTLAKIAYNAYRGYLTSIIVGIHLDEFEKLTPVYKDAWLAVETAVMRDYFKDWP